LTATEKMKKISFRKTQVLAGYMGHAAPKQMTLESFSESWTNSQFQCDYGMVY